MPPADIVAIVAVAFLAAGWVKGAVGMGLPTVAMGTMGLVMHPAQAAALLVVPSLVTNIWQFVAGPSARQVVRRLFWMLVLVCAGIALGIRFLTGGGARWPTVALGVVLALYALVGLFLPKLSVPEHRERLLSPVIGGVTGVLAGATGVFVVPAVPYLGSLALTKDELIQALGLSFTVSTVALAVALGAAGGFTKGLLLASLAAVVPALVGMYVGQATRDRIEPAAFRRWFLVAMLLVGTWMAIKGFLAR